MSIRCGVLLLFISCSLFANAQVDKFYDLGITDTLIIRGNDSFAPFESLDKHGHPVGFNIDLMKALMQELKFKYKLELESVDDCMRDVKEGRAHIISGLSYSKKRNDSFSFGLPVNYIDRKIISLKSAPVRDKADLYGKRIIVQESGWTRNYMETENITDNLVYGKDMQEMLQLLKQGKGDAVIAGDQAAYYEIKRLHLDNLHIVSLGIKPLPYTYVVLRGNEELLFRLNEGIQQLKRNGKYDEIYNKWFGVYDKKDNAEIIRITIAISLMLFIIAFFVIFRLWRVSLEGRKKMNYIYSEMQMALKVGEVSTFVYKADEKYFYPLNYSHRIGSRINMSQICDMLIKEDVVRFNEMIQNIIDGRSNDGKCRLQTRDDAGEFRNHFYDVQMIGFKDHESGKLTMVGALKDVTESVNLQQEMKMKQEKAENANKMKSAFLANMSHDIRTPLNAIISFNRLLADNNGIEITQEDKEQMVDMIEHNVETISTLVNDVLDMAKFESGTYNVSPTDANINMICKTVIESIKTKVHDGVQLVYKPENVDFTLYTDAVRLQQVITNYMTNACKYTEHGSIELKYEVLQNKVIFSVTDTGCGIKKEDAEKCFDRFKMLDKSVSGTGLGLHICKLIASILHGKAYVDTSYSSGARFVFEHPIAGSDTHPFS